MKSLYFAILLITLALTGSAFADVKIKSRQTASGQTFENTTYIKGKRQRTEQNMGAMQMVNLTQCDLNRGVQLNPMAKTYIINLYEQNQSTIQNPQSKIGNDGVVRAGGTVTTTITYKDTGETKKMFGYTARRIITTMETISSADACSPLNSKMEMDGWYIDAAFALDCQNNQYKNGYTPPQRAGCQDKYQTKQIGSAKRGYPVYEKMTMFDTSGKEIMTMTNEVIELSQATLESALFEIPADYREVKDSSELYSASSYGSSSSSTDMPSMPSNGTTTKSATVSTINNAAQSNSSVSTEIGTKKEGVIRIGLAGVKTGAVGDGMNAADLAAAFQNTLGEYLKGTNIELVQIEAKLPAAIDAEAKQKECDYILFANVSHKKGGGGFGGFGSVLAQGIGSIGIGHTGSTVGNVAGQIATQTIVSAASMSANVKSKDEITLDIKVQHTGGASVVSKQFKAKAKSNGEDIITPVVEQAAQTVFSAVRK